MGKYIILPRCNLVSAISSLVVIGWLLVTFAAPLLAPYDPNFQDIEARLDTPSTSHPFGTDQLGRDILVRVMYGGRASIPLGFGLVATACAIGTLIGALAGYVGGVVDEVLMRIADVVLAFPSMVLAMAFAAALGPGLAHVMIAIAFVWWPRYARIMRGMVVSVKQKEFVVAARAVGAGDTRILIHHIWPNTARSIAVCATLDVGQGIMMGAWLGFLGLGAVPPTPEWGAMVASGTSVFQQWWVATFPALAILSVVLGVNFLGDTIIDAVDPRTRAS